MATHLQRPVERQYDRSAGEIHEWLSAACQAQLQCDYFHLRTLETRYNSAYGDVVPLE